MAAPELDAWFDQFSFSYLTSRDGDVHEVVLPFRILVLGDFGVPHDSAVPLPLVATTITARGFDESMASHGLHLEIPLESLDEVSSLLAKLDVSAFVLDFQCLADFRPDRLLAQEATLNAIHGLLGRLKGQVRNYQDGSEVPMPALGGLERQLVQLWLEEAGLARTDERCPEALDRDQLVFMVTDLAAELNLAVNHLLHHPGFQRIEAAWRGLHLLATQSAGDAYCQIDYVSVTRERLYEDLVFSTTLEESDVFDLLYTREYGQYGGQPYGAVIGDYSFSHQGRDIDLLQGIGRACQQAHCVFLGALSPHFFGLDEFSGLSGLSSVQELLEGRPYLRWRAFQKTEQAAYIALTLPRILLRDVWRSEKDGILERVAAERSSARGQDSLWGNAAFALGCCLLRSFRRFRMCTHLTGADGGMVAGLPRVKDPDTGESVFPVEMLLSENREADLITLGLTPLSVAKANGEVLFHAANSLRWGYFQRRGEAGDVPLGARLGAQMPYLLIILRIAHYLRMIYREQQGSTRSLADLRGELLGWLKRYVSDVESPAPAVRARRPLKNVSLLESGTDDSGEWHEMKLVITPHIRYGGNEYALSVDMNMS